MKSFPKVVGARFGSRRWGLYSLALFVLTGCGYWINPNASVPSGPGTSSQSGSVTISPTYVAVAPGQKLQFTAASSTGGQIEWLVNGTAGGKPEAGKIDANR